MKTVKQIKKELAKNREAIAAKKELIKKLDFTEERTQAAQNGRFNNEMWHKYYNLAQENAGEVEKLRGEIYKLEIKTRILRENLSCALIAEAAPVIIKALEAYQGKPYGDKTRDKIREEVKKAGFSFYLDGRGGYRININELGADGYNSGLSAIAAVYDDGGHAWDVLTADNKINIAGASVKPWKNKYYENPTKAAGEVAKAIKKYEEATQAIEKQRGELCRMLPEGIEEPAYIKDYYIRF